MRNYIFVNTEIEKYGFQYRVNNLHLATILHHPTQLQGYNVFFTCLSVHQLQLVVWIVLPLVDLIHSNFGQWFLSNLTLDGIDFNRNPSMESLFFCEKNLVKGQ